MVSDTIAVDLEIAEAAESSWPIEAPPQEPPTPAATEPAGVDLNDMDAAMAWLEALALKQGAEEDSLKITAPETRSDTPPEWIAALADQDRPAEPIEVLPPEPAAELQDFQPADERAIGAPAQPAVPAEEAQAAEEPSGETDIPDWLLNYEEEQQLKTQTWQAPAETAGQAAVQLPAADDSVTLWLQRHHPEPGSIPAEEPTEEEISAVDWSQPEPVEEEPLSPVQSVDYAEAQSALERGRLDEAVEIYTRLVNSGEHIDETINDLNKALDRHPVDVGIWQLLGDAYSKADKIQEALDAYTKAEDLLQ
jgi:tetratricopeptide (TPR) repeat protein